MVRQEQEKTYLDASEFTGLDLHILILLARSLNNVSLPDRLK